MLTVGVPKEIKSREKRVALVPSAVKILAQAKLSVLVERNAGQASGFSDIDYLDAGARIVPDAESVYRDADLIQKVKEPLSPEYELLRPKQFLFCFLHLASPENCALVKVLRDKKITALAYETLEKDSRTPILAPMSEIAGGLAAAYAAFFQRLTLDARDGKIIYPNGFQASLETVANLYPKAPDFLKAGEVVVFGGGVAGKKAAVFSLQMGGSVTVVEKKAELRQQLEKELKPLGFIRAVSPDEDLSAFLARADVLIGAVHSPGKRAACMFSRETLKNASLVKKKIMIDISIDQGGNFPDAAPTTYDSPLTVDEFANIRFGVPNIPSLCGHGASQAISAITLPYTQGIAISFTHALQDYPELRSAINLQNGQICNLAVSEAHRL